MCVGVGIPVHSSAVGYLVFTVSCVLFLVSLLAVFVVYMMLVSPVTVVMKQRLTACACATAASL